MSAEQPRVPSGSSEGGQWASTSRGGGVPTGTKLQGDWLAKDQESDAATAQALVGHLTKKLLADIDAGRDSNESTAKLHKAQAQLKGVLESRKAPALAPPALPPAASAQALPPAQTSPETRTVWLARPKLTPPPQKVDGHLDKLWPDPPDSIMSNDEARSWGGYISMGYSSINSHLRGQFAGKQNIVSAVRHLDSLFAKVKPLDKEVVVNRGINGDIAKRVGSLKKGATFSDKGFISTSFSKSVARGFAKSKGIVVAIRVPKGSRVIPGERTENELILPRGSHFKVVGKSKGKIVLEVVS